MPDVTLRQMRYFVAVVDSGSVTAAAESEHVSQAALSMAVAQLEVSVGTDLLIRSRSRRAVPTRRGLLFAAHARRVLEGVDEAVGAVTDSVGVLTGTVRVGCSFTLSPRVIPVLIDRFTRDHPGVEVEFEEGAPNDIQEQVRMGRLDLSVLYSQQADPALRRHVLADVHLHVVLPADHPLADRDAVDIEEFISMDAILLSVPPTVERLTEQIRASGHEPRIRYTSRNIQTILSLVARGYGYSLINSPPATEETFDGRRVRFLPVDGMAQTNEIVAVTTGHHRQPRRVRAAIEALTGV